MRSPRSCFPSKVLSRRFGNLPTRFLRDRYNTTREQDRKAEAKKRLDLFRDRGRPHFEKALDSVFKNARVRQ